MKRIDIRNILDYMELAGCSEADMDRVRRLHDASLDEEILRCLKICRCDIIEVLHKDQRRLDRINDLIRTLE